ncbi:MAG TPA: toll/interleukin-1 receptor domain-containing protein [Pyrinomonadaceae bacterium]|nr:toll/interleukin-1 receptor domain-containing protein [Pyrinomonadaceae bacterium]
MPSLTKKDKLAKLERAVKRLRTLKRSPSLSQAFKLMRIEPLSEQSPEFKACKQYVEEAIRLVFGEYSHYVEDFNEIEFSSVYSNLLVASAVDNKAREKEFNSGLDKAEALLLQMYRDVNEIREEREQESGTKFDVFLSYSSKNAKEANLIREAIQAAGGMVFFDKSSLRGGDTFAERIREAISICRELWLLASPDSLKSEWVKREYTASWGFRKNIVPILLELTDKDLINDDILRGLHCIRFADYPTLVRRTFRST